MHFPFLCEPTIYMLSNGLELIPNFQELFIIIITISPQAADNTLFRIITHFDLDKEKNNEVERKAANASIHANNIFHSSQGREHSQTKNWSFSSEYSFCFCYCFALGPWSHLSTLVKTRWVVFSCRMCLCPDGLSHLPQHSFVYTGWGLQSQSEALDRPSCLAHSNF